MAEVNLKKLTRRQLLELLLKQTERAEQLEEQLSEANRMLQNRALMEEEAGSIAAASLKLNGVFEAAEAAASQYLENIEKLNADREAALEQAKAEAKEKAALILSHAENLCARQEEKAQQAQKRLEAIQEQIRQLYDQKRVLDAYFDEAMNHEA